MIKAADRVPQAKAEPAPVAQSTAQVPPAEPADEVVLQVQKLNLRTGVLVPVFTYKMNEGQVTPFEDALTETLANLPKAPKKTAGRPPVRIIVTRVDKKDPNFVSMGGEPYVVGEVTTLPDFISNMRVRSESKVSAPLAQYYFRDGKPFESHGYTVIIFEHFLKCLLGPAKRDYQALADAHEEWCKESNETPFE
jgi:hypothetical protein